MADRPVDAGLTTTLDRPYVGRRIAQVPPPVERETTQPELLEPELPEPELPEPELPEPKLPRIELDTAEVERVLATLEPVDQTTSFEHEPTTELPRFPAEPAPAPSTPGKRRALKHAGRRGPLFKGLPSAPVLVGVAALAVSIGGVLTASDTGMVSNDGDQFTPPSALSGASGDGKAVGERRTIVSRDSNRDAQSDAAGEALKEAAEGQLKERYTALRQLASDAEKRSQVIAKNLWRYPLSSVSLTARFGQYGLWSGYHTGLDFNGATGDPIMAVANGVVTSASYDGAYGNKTVVTLEDGTEIWYCHQNTFGVEVGESVRAGEVIGTVGATGHVTGSHLHLEVRPGGGDPVDPYAAMEQHGLF